MQDTLRLALAHHERGLLGRAALLYRQILAVQPNHAEVLHLLGIAVHQQGNHAQAAELIGRAIRYNSGAAIYHANLAEIYRALGQRELAVQCCRTALRLEPTNATAANNLGNLLLEQGVLEAAAEQFRLALSLRPSFALASNNLGTVFRLRGDGEEALSHFRRAVQLDPALALAHSNLGQILLERKQLEEALEHCQAAVRLQPNLAEAHGNLGNVLRELGRLDQAKACYAEGLRLNPKLAMLHGNMGQALQEEGQYQEAFACYICSLQIEPKMARLHCNLGNLLAELEQFDDAALRYKMALRLDSNYAEAFDGLGCVRREQDRHEEAQECFRAALRLKPELASAHVNLGAVYEEQGDFALAESCYRSAVGNDPRHAGAWSQLAFLLRDKLPEEDLEKMRSLLRDPDVTDGRRALLDSGLAHVLDGRKEYSDAAQHALRANGLTLARRKLRGQAYDPVAHSQFVDRVLATFTQDYFERVRGFGADSERPVFIVGLPRSGTTLTEQVLATHSQVFGAGEQYFGRADFEMLANGRGEANAFEKLACLDAATVQRLAAAHLERLRILNDTALRVVDKLPDNYLYLGLLATLFPKARFIHCRRDLRDVAVSCWMTNFRHVRWASDPEHLAARFRDYQRLIDHWREMLPVPILEVDYEETVADLVGVAQRLIAWCGLEWEPACAAFHEAKHPVRTASVVQVRRPVHTGSVARWKNYEASLGPLFAKLLANQVRTVAES
jgi:tetratricopeptide (TPR) repeat protein